jgi:hypothetical protein
MIEVYQIPVPLEKIRAMPEDERALFILLGYAANQLNFFSKLVIFSTNQDGRSELEQMLSAAQTQMVLRVLIGVLQETWRLIKTRYMKAPFAKEYTRLLDAAGAEAFERLKKELNGPNRLISRLRNSWVFHHPETSDLTVAFEESAKSPEWRKLAYLYFSHSNYNSFYLISDFIALNGIAISTEESDIIEAQKKLLNKITAISDDCTSFIQNIIAILWKKYVGDDMSAEKVHSIDNALDFSIPWIPFFVNIPDHHSSSP